MKLYEPNPVEIDRIIRTGMAKHPQGQERQPGQAVVVIAPEYNQRFHS